MTLILTSGMSYPLPPHLAKRYIVNESCPIWEDREVVATHYFAMTPTRRLAREVIVYPDHYEVWTSECEQLVSHGPTGRR